MKSFSLDEQSTILNSTANASTPIEPSSPPQTFNTPAPVNTMSASDNSEVVSSNDENNIDRNDSDSVHHKEQREKDDHKEKLKAEKKAAKKLMKELTICKIILEEMEVTKFKDNFKLEHKLNRSKQFFHQVHEDSWPFLLPVNTKQFPTYKKVIKNPMDLSTIKKRCQDTT